MLFLSNSSTQTMFLHASVRRIQADSLSYCIHKNPHIKRKPTRLQKEYKQDEYKDGLITMSVIGTLGL